MDQRKLFNVLVIGGALLGLGCEGETSSPPGEDTPTLTDAASPVGEDGGEGNDGGEIGTDAAAPLADAAPRDAAAAIDAGGELENCGFCPNECCVDDGMGGSKARDGFECCWSTSC